MRRIKKLLSYVMILTLVFTMCNASVFATETQQEAPADPALLAEEAAPEVTDLNYTVEPLAIETYNVKFTWIGKNATSYDISVVKNGGEPEEIKNFVDQQYIVEELAAGDNCSIEVTPIFIAEGNEPVRGTAVKMEATVAKPGMVSGVEAHPDYESVYMMWNPIADHNGKYVVRRTGGGIEYYYTDENLKVDARNGKMGFRVKSGSDRNGLAITYNWAVAAVSEEGVVGDFTPIVKAKRVETMYIVGTAKAKNTRYYSKHRKGKRLGRLKRGTKIYAIAYKGGRYGFLRNGKLVWVNRLNLRTSSSINSNPYSNGAKLKYRLEGFKARTEDARYSDISKENFFMHRAEKKFNEPAGYTTSTTPNPRYGIWVSLHTQEVTIFIDNNWRNRRKAGYAPDWKVHKEYWCATGKADTPTVHTVGTIHKRAKRSKKRSLRWLSYFAGGNAMHTKRAKNVLGRAPLSHGCVRMEVPEAKWVYDNCLKSRVVVY